MKKALLILFVLLIALSMAAFTFAQEEPASSTEVAVEETISDDSGILPGNPFYFLKEWGRSFRGSFISDPIKRVEFELKVTTEKGEELKRVSQFNRQEAIEKALSNYEKSMTSLRKRFEELKDISNNPNVDELLQKIAERTEEHKQLFEELSNKFEALRGRFGAIQSDWENVIGPLFKGAENISQIRNKITEMVGSGSPGYGAILEIINRVGDEIQTEPGEGAATSSEVISSDIQTSESAEEYRTEEQVRGAEPYPMPSMGFDKLNSIMLGVKETFQMGQTEHVIQPSICLDVYDPVCGEDGRIYSNECYATRANVRVAYDGTCKE